MNETNVMNGVEGGDINDQSGTPEPAFAGRGVSIRRQIIRSQSLILILLLLIVISTSVTLSRVDRAIADANEEMMRTNRALEVRKGATDLLMAYTQGVATYDAAEFTRNVSEAEQSLLDAEEQLTQSAASLPPTDPVQIELDELKNLTSGIYGLVDSMVEHVERGEWWPVEQFALGTAAYHRDLVFESVESLQDLTEERRSAAEDEAKAARRLMRVTVLGLSLALVVVTLGTGVVITRNIAQPMERLVETTGRLAAGHLEERAPLGRVEEFARLAAAFNEMADQIQDFYVQMEQRAVERERLQQEVIEAQKQAIQELSSPVIPVMDTPQGSIIVMPLIGSIDTMRARDITRTLLAGIREHRANVVILDITGVPVVDSGVANHLNKTIQAARLKGTRTIVTGISDAVAETIVDLGIDWKDIETVRNLQTGLRVALAGTDLPIDDAKRGTK
jgi:anti-anti-sigma regulatory factor/HAMP domain-containing protein